MDRILKSKYKIQDKIADSPSHVTYKGCMVDSDKNIVIKIYRRQYLDSVFDQAAQKKISTFFQNSQARSFKTFRRRLRLAGFLFHQGIC